MASNRHIKVMYKGKEYKLHILAKRAGLSVDAVGKRWRKLGSPPVVKEWMFAHDYKNHPERKKYFEKKLKAKADEKRGKPIKQLIGSNVSNKGNTPWSKMSSTKNTGAGRGEIPNEEWIGMIGRRRSISAALCQLNLVQVQTSTI